MTSRPLEPERPRAAVLRGLREIIPPELVRALAEADFTARYEKVCAAHPPRLQAVTGSQRRDATHLLDRLGKVQRRPGGNHGITVEDHPEGVEFEVCWRPDSRVDAFLILEDDGRRTGGNFAVLASAARAGAVPPGQPSHPRPYAATGEEFVAIVADLLALGSDAGKRWGGRPGRDLGSRPPPRAARRIGDAGAAIAQRTARMIEPRSAAPERADLSIGGLGRVTRRSAGSVIAGVQVVFVLFAAIPLLLLEGMLVYVVAAGVLILLLTGSIELGWRRQRVAAKYVQSAHEELATRALDDTRSLRAILAGQDFRPGVEQLASLERQYSSLAELLGRKLDPAELTYKRYLATGEQVYLAALDNLTRIVDILDGLSAIDVGYISRRIRHLQTDGIESAAQDAEIRTLEERLGLLETEQARVRELLSANEAAMTRLAHATSVISAMDTAAPHAQVGMEAAMSDLRELIERAPAYAREP